MCPKNTISDARTLLLDVLPGFDLMQSTREESSWPLGAYALVERGVPLVVIQGPLLVDPTEGMTEDDLCPMPAFPEADQYEAAVDQLANSLVLDADSGYRLVASAMALGYDPAASGSLEFWLLNHLAVAVNNA